MKKRENKRLSEVYGLSIYRDNVVVSVVIIIIKISTRKHLPQIQVNFCLLTYSNCTEFLTLPALSVTESHTYPRTQLWTRFL